MVAHLRNKDAAEPSRIFASLVLCFFFCFFFTFSLLCDFDMSFH